MPLINCPECQKLISDQSYACPHCGYSLKAPLPSQEKKERFSLISFLVKIFVAIIFFSFVYTYVSSKTGDISNNSSSSRVVSNENVEIEATAQQIINEYQNNEVRGDALIKDKIVKVTGIVISISSDISDKAVVELGSNSSELSLINVMASGDNDFHNTAIELKKGQKITLICKGAGEIIGSPQLSNCIFDYN